MEKKSFEIKIKPTYFQDKFAILLIVTDTTKNDTIVKKEEVRGFKSRLISSFSNDIRNPLNSSLCLL